ncbi:hypothetical protein [Candidatus Entotheonella palauensis]|uniref:Uncharacterized protein n=1 Tax=Candidatus Entotheonella gemina TaxID=1429439 RepID=W4LLL1_9BACT|nr:hypothetical protein [Candidatus Entotheonella palauensis]ETW98857.1 MAG: hypothetical protein ETSY2_42085 [Candidatus Entotheonella gemina]
MQNDVEKQLFELVGRYRLRCLWFLAADFVPETDEQAIQVLEYIERYGDREGFVQARRLKQCLSPSISKKSVSRSPTIAAKTARATSLAAGDGGGIDGPCVVAARGVALSRAAVAPATDGLKHGADW